MSTTDLKPCPFCGATDTFVERGTLSSCFVQCNQCQARGPDTCPEDDEDLRLEEENDWDPGEAAARRLWNRRTLPEGMALLPREITAETGHKAGMIGDFKESVEVMCSECDSSDPDAECGECGGLLFYRQEVPVSWTTIKAIHRRIVEVSGGAS